MKVSIEIKSELERRLSVTVPADEMAVRYSRELRLAARDMHLKGFRPGHVPTSEIERRFGTQVRKRVAGDVAQKVLPKAIEQEALVLASKAWIELGDWQAGQDLHFHANFDCMPDIELVNLATLTLVRPTVEITRKEVEEAVLRLCKQLGRWDEVTDRGARQGDRVVLDMTLKDAVTAEIVETLKDVKHIVDDSTEGPLGLPIGDRFKDVRAGQLLECECDKPPDYYPSDDLAEHSLVVVCSIIKVEAAEMMAPDDPQLLSMVQVDSPEELREFLKSDMESRRDELVSSLLRAQGMERLLCSTDFTLPESLVREELGHQRAREKEWEHTQNLQNSSPRNVAEENTQADEFDDARLRIFASRTVKSRLLLRQIAETHDVKVADEDIEEEAYRIAASSDNPQGRLDELLADEAQLLAIELALRERATVEYVLNHATVTERAVSYETLVHMHPMDLMPDLEAAETEPEAVAGVDEQVVTGQAESGQAESGQAESGQDTR